jgi:hypothetical protein
MKTNIQMKSEKLSDDDIPFKTLFPNAFKVKVESMKTKGSGKTCLNGKEKAKARDKSDVKSKDQDETNEKSAMIKVDQDDRQDEKKGVKDKVKEEDINVYDLFGDESDDDDISAFFGK